MTNERTFAVYILTNEAHTTLSAGVTNNLVRRMEEHRIKSDPKSFTAKYNLTKLVYFDITDSPSDAIGTEKRIKGWSRAKKDTLITERNPKWRISMVQSSSE